ncbi:MAG: hypothetical protein ABW321_08610 [Polyangiales bacterium]
MDQQRHVGLLLCSLASSFCLAACGDDDIGPGVDAGTVGGGYAAGSGGQPAGGHGGRSGSGGRAGSHDTSPGQVGGSGAGSGSTTTSPDNYPAAGNPDGKCPVPSDATLEDVSRPTTVIGTGTPASCTGSAVVDAVAKGGVITFACGDAPVTIELSETAKVFNDASPKIVIDGGGKVTLSGRDQVRILYQNTCDEAQHWTTPHCADQPEPQLIVQNLTFAHGAAKSLRPDGGGAIFARGGRLKIINSRFFQNSCNDTGPDVGGAAVRAFDQSEGKPLYVVNSTFGGRSDLGNVCSNGGGLSSIGVSYTVINSLFSHNRAVGFGANPARSGTPGGGSGGAIYNDGNTFTLTLCGTHIEDNTAVEGGGAIFFVSNDHSGSLVIDDSLLRENVSHGFETDGYPGIFVLDDDDKAAVRNSTIE